MRDITEYCLETYETAIYPEDEHKIDYLMLGLISEVGELAGIFKRIYRDTDIDLKNNETSKIEAVLDMFDPDLCNEALREKVILELGDIMWYLARISIELDIPLEYILERNITKLKNRKLNHTLKGNGDNR